MITNWSSIGILVNMSNKEQKITIKQYMRKKNVKNVLFNKRKNDSLKRWKICVIYNGEIYMKSRDLR